MPWGVWPRDCCRPRRRTPAALHLTLTLDQPEKKLALFGPADRHLKTLRELLNVNLVARGEDVRVTGTAEAVGRATRVLEQLQSRLKRRDHLTPEDVADAVRTVQNIEDARDEKSLEVFARGTRIRAKTPGQQNYLGLIGANDLTFCTGPAGTGKTYLAVAAAACLLKHGHVRKLVLVRPAVEAGEKLGFLPGSMQDKVNPYLRPLLDALNDMMEFEHIQRFMSVDLIEIIPLAFMRGRTLNDAAVILDEAQNATRSQMLMFLTRLGHGSKMVITGDASQTDLDNARDSGLVDAVRRLGRVKGVAATTLDGRDIVRHRLVQRIVEAYGDADTG